jgi:hypothetical protein
MVPCGRLAALAPASGAIEANASADLRPMRRIELAQFGSDRHGRGFYLMLRTARNLSRVIWRSKLQRVRLRAHGGVL